MLIEYEKGLPKKAETPQVMMIKGGKIQKSNKKSLKAKGKGKANGKGKDKQVYIPKPKNPKPSAKEHPAKDDTCHHYKEVGHFKELQCGRGRYILDRNSRREDTTLLKSLAATFLKRWSVLNHHNTKEEVISIVGDLGEPANYKAAMLDPESKKWVDVMNTEMQSMIDNMIGPMDVIGLRRLDLNKTQGASTPEEVKHMQNIPYASAVGSIIRNPGRMNSELIVIAILDLRSILDDMKYLTGYISL
ncbi:hypothetical protein Tco_1091355 [Tanacetum coccineum]|uniref:Uncharacterized protein n=1 Tax=Tanacetum coccineum TaxID=301880 RepID=A0ABQ5I6R8_9ASTR